MAFSHTPAAAAPGSHAPWPRLRGMFAAGLTACLSVAQAQTDTPTTERPSAKVERITHEDGGSRVEELRVGGQTRQIEVTTKSGLPAYHIHPADGAQGPASPAGQRSGLAGSPGRSSWRLFDF